MSPDEARADGSALHVASDRPRREAPATTSHDGSSDKSSGDGGGRGGGGGVDWAAGLGKGGGGPQRPIRRFDCEKGPTAEGPG